MSVSCNENRCLSIHEVMESESGKVLRFDIDFYVHIVDEDSATIPFRVATTVKVSVTLTSSWLSDDRGSILSLAMGQSFWKKDHKELASKCIV